MTKQEIDTNRKAILFIIRGENTVLGSKFRVQNS